MTYICASYLPCYDYPACDDVLVNWPGIHYRYPLIPLQQVLREGG